MLDRFRLELAFAGVILLVGALGLLGSAELDTGWASDGPQAGYFPFRVSVILIGAAALVVVNAWRARGTLAKVRVIDREGGRRVLRFGLPVLGMVAVAQWLGLYVAMALYLLVAIHWVGGRRLATALAVALGVTVASFVVFEKWFGVPLLKGPLEPLLGLG